MDRRYPSRARAVLVRSGGSTPALCQRPYDSSATLTVRGGGGTHSAAGAQAAGQQVERLGNDEARNDRVGRRNGRNDVARIRCTADSATTAHAHARPFTNP
jgi:hypothetical protein